MLRRWTGCKKWQTQRSAVKLNTADADTDVETQTPAAAAADPSVGSSGATTTAGSTAWSVLRRHASLMLQLLRREDVLHPLKVALIITTCSLFDLVDALEKRFPPGQF